MNNPQKMFPVGTLVKAFSLRTERMEYGKVTSHLADVPGYPYGLAVTFSDGETIQIYNAYINLKEPEYSLVRRFE